MKEHCNHHRCNLLVSKLTVSLQLTVLLVRSYNFRKSLFGKTCQVTKLVILGVREDIILQSVTQHVRFCARA